MLAAGIYEKLLRLWKVHVLQTLALGRNVFKVAFGYVQYSALQTKCFRSGVFLKVGTAV